MIEGASGQDFLTFLRSSITEPLELSSTVADNRFLVVPHRTRFYHRLDDGRLIHTPEVDNSYKWASGGLLSTAEDLVRFGLAHVDPGFFEASTLEGIFTPQAGTDRGSFRVGLGWRISEDGDGDRYYHHGGAIAGGRAYLIVFPRTRSVVALLANRFVGLGEEEARRVLAPVRGVRVTSRRLCGDTGPAM